MNRFIRICFATLLCCSPLVSNASPKLVGLAEYSELRRPYYMAAFYSDEPVSFDQAPSILSSSGVRKMELRILADSLSTRRFNVQWSQSFFINNSQAELLRFDESLMSFQNLLDTPFERGDSITVESDNTGLVTVSVNGIESFMTQEAGFLELLLAKWIGSKPPSTNFKMAIMAGEPDPTKLVSFQSLQPSEARIETVRLQQQRDIKAIAAVPKKSSKTFN